ncbi:nitroreductase family protein [Christiangramia portivictoriae]|uniref:nitroreductase family protein n=1 Tax=Christiangramia portivictoriae TaxID=326069 RepID=UPI0004192FBE|nr:nitroreductase family protein [Christiangramia portivictoriae]
MEEKFAKKVVEVNGFPHIPLYSEEFTEAEMLARTGKFYSELSARRSVRHFSDRPVSKDIIEQLIITAGTAPSGAHKQPWKFCAISSEEIKRQIRIAAEEEERSNYNSRMSEQWLKDLAPLGTDTNKEFLQIAPWIIVVFKQVYELGPEKDKRTNYYVNESVGIACGMLIAAIHHAGLVTLTHTPSPMNFLSKILERPENERPFLLLPVGYAAKNALVPDLQRKSLEKISVFYE